MKHTVYSIIVLLLLCALPVFAQRGGDRPTPGTGGRGGDRVQERGGNRYEGRIQEASKDQITLVLYVRATSPDAPGKVPDVYAAQAAVLEDQANQLAKNKRIDMANRLREKVKELRSMREATTTITAKKETDGAHTATTRNEPVIPAITGLITVPLTNLTKGTRLALTAAVEGKPGDATPTSMTLARPAREVGAQEPLSIRALPRGNRDEQTMYSMVGEVVSANPLVVKVDDNTSITLENPKNFACWQLKPLTFEDLKPNEPIIARANVKDDLSIESVDRVLVFPGGEIPYEHLGDMRIGM